VQCLIPHSWIIDSIRAYGPWSVFAGVIVESVIVPIPSPLVLMSAGFILISPRCLFLGYLDWWMGDTYHDVAYGIDRAETVISVVIILAILAFIFWLRTKVRGKILERNDLD